MARMEGTYTEKLVSSGFAPNAEYFEQLAEVIPHSSIASPRASGHVDDDLRGPPNRRQPPRWRGPGGCSALAIRRTARTGCALVKVCCGTTVTPPDTIRLTYRMFVVLYSLVTWVL